MSKPYIDKLYSLMSQMSSSAYDTLIVDSRLDSWMISNHKLVA